MSVWTNPNLANNKIIYLFSCGKLAYKWVCVWMFVIELAYMLYTNHLYLKKKMLTSEGACNLNKTRQSQRCMKS